ncbi:aspartyl protease [Ceratobasidium sp. AG-Ba]|nr:aspartyl protease [Ceratobasidium sp. AG-Ba]
MFISATNTLAGLVLAGLVSAVPLDAPKRIGVVVPLHKRGHASLSNNGVIVPSALANAAKRVQVKYTRGNAAYKQRFGEDLFDFGATLVKRQAEALTDEQEELWAGEITIGTPHRVSWSTLIRGGSADLWVPNAGCTTGGCKGHKTFDVSKSSTVQPQTGNFSISYGDGSTSSGPISDTVMVAGLTVHAVTAESDSFAQDPSDGLMGLAFSSISQIGQPTFPENLKSAGMVKSNVFAFKLAPTGSELYFGGTNSQLFTEGYSGGMIIDSGTTLIVGPTDSVDKFGKLRVVRKCDSQDCGGDGFYTFDCANPPSVAFNFGGVLLLCLATP